MALKIYKNLANTLKLKIRKFQGHILAFREVTRENLEGGGTFLAHLFNIFAT